MERNRTVAEDPDYLSVIVPTRGVMVALRLGQPGTLARLWSSSSEIPNREASSTVSGLSASASVPSPLC